MHQNFQKLIFAISVLFIFQPQAFAVPVDCTSIPSLVVSHFVENNNLYGGHLNAHVRGQTPPAGYTQSGRTLFRDSDDWEDAYRALANQIPALQCNTTAEIGTEAARTLPRQYFSFQCTQANQNGVCVVANEIQTNHVRYVMRVVPNDGGRRWVVYNAYPTPN